MRTRIILAAEELFAAQGIDGVSLRQIATAAGHGNNNAVQYHFASKQGLVHEIFHHRIGQFEEQRAAMLEHAEKEGLLSDAPTLAKMLLFPHLTITNERGGHPYAGFSCHYLIRYRPFTMPHPGFDERERFPFLGRVLDLIEARASYVPASVMRSRIGLVVLMFLNMLVRFDNTPETGRTDVSFDFLVEDTLLAATHCLFRPVERHSGSPLFALPS